MNFAASLIVKKDEVLCANEGWLYGSFHVLRPITPDDADGRLLLRNLFGSAGSVLIANAADLETIQYFNNMYFEHQVVDRVK